MENKNSTYLPSTSITRIDVYTKKLIGRIETEYSTAKTFLGFTYSHPKTYYVCYKGNHRVSDRYRTFDTLLSEVSIWWMPLDRYVSFENGEYTIFDKEEAKLYNKPIVKVTFENGVVLFNTFETDNEAVVYAEKLNMFAHLTSFDYIGNG